MGYASVFLSMQQTNAIRLAIRAAPIVAAASAIFLVAAYLRLWGLEHSPTGNDQAVLINIALRWITHGQFPLAANKSSAGLMNPPLLEYLLALPLFLKRDMLLVAQFVALVNIASVVVTLLVVRATFGWRLALLTTLLYAVNPWSVYYSRLIWNPTMIPLFSALLLGSLTIALTDRRQAWQLALVFVWLAAAIQLHLSSAVLAPAVGLLLLIFRRQLRPKWLLIGLLLFALSFVPYLIHEQATGFADVADFLQGGGEAIDTNLASVSIGLELAGERGIMRTMGEAWPEWRAAAPWGDEIRRLAPWLLPVGLIVAGVLLFSRRAEFRQRQLTPVTVGLVVAATLLTVPILLNVRHAIYLQNYYFLYLYPVVFVFMALPADAALEWANRLPPRRRRVLLPLALAPTILVVLLGARQIYLNHTGLQLIGQDILGHQQIRHVQQAIDTLADIGRQRPDCDLIVASDGHDADSSTLGQVGEFLAPRPVRHVRLMAGAIIPRSCGFYLVASDDALARAWYEAHATRLPDRTIRLPGDAWHFYELTSAARDSLSAALSATPILGQWDNGTRLRHADVSGAPEIGSSLGLTLTWEVYAASSHREYHFFNHLLDENGALITQADGPGVFSRYWQPGEFFITWFEMRVPADLPSGHHRLAVGLYDWPSLARSHLVSGGDSLTLEAGLSDQ